MKNKYWFIPLFICCISSLGLSAQSISRQVVGSSGDYYTNAVFGDLHFTVGEVAVAQLQNEAEISEGFHRTYYQLLVYSEEPHSDAWDVQVFPNPTANLINIRLHTAQPNARYTLYNAMGQQIATGVLELYETQLDMTAFAAGAYWLTLFDKNNQQESFQIQKIKN